MTVDTLQPGAERRSRVSVATEAQAERWAVALCCTRAQLLEALALGPDTTEQVRQRLYVIQARDRRPAARQASPRPQPIPVS